MKSILNLDKTPSAIKCSVKAAAKLKCELLTDIKMEDIPFM